MDRYQIFKTNIVNNNKKINKYIYNIIKNIICKFSIYLKSSSNSLFLSI